ncbi:MAG: Na+:solute symporter, partial [Calditrichaeota bacterium]|nr:Na+:solute symporter [Calditrichota bacterium]
ILRWFWWRINAYSEITAMVVSFLIALYFNFVHSHTGLPELSNAAQLVSGVLITTAAWVLVTFLTRPVDTTTLLNFYRLVRPGGPGWQKLAELAAKDGGLSGENIQRDWDVPSGILAMIAGCLAVYGMLFAVGYWIYGNTGPATIMTLIALGAGAWLVRFFRK